MRARKRHQTVGARKLAVAEQYEYAVGDAVVADGFPGTVTAINDAPFGAVSYAVTLDNGVGHGEYLSRQLYKPEQTTAAAVMPHEVGELEPVEAATAGRADYWYPELGTVLEERVPNERIHVYAAMREQLDPDTDVALDGKTHVDIQQDKIDMANEVTNPTQSDDQPAACGFCGCPEFTDFTDTGRGVRARCAQCAGTMVRNTGGVQWQVEFPNSFANAPARSGDYRSTINDPMAVHAGSRLDPNGWHRDRRPGYEQAEADCPHKHWDSNGTCQGCGYNAGDHQDDQDLIESAFGDDSTHHGDWLLSQQNTGPSKYSALQTEADAGDWCRFRMNQQCMLPNRLNAPASASAGYTIFTPMQRGLCNRYTATQQQACPTGMPKIPVPGRYVDPLWATGSLREGAYFHNSDAELNPGDEIVPAAERGHQSRWADVPGYSPHHVYMYNHLADPLSYEEHGKHVYEVEPLGPVSHDPEYEHNKADYAAELNQPGEDRWAESDVPGYYSHVTPRARVIRRHAVQPDTELGFHMTATWAEVQEKAKRIRAEGGVRVLAATGEGVVGEVRGDNATYEATLHYVPGSKKVADWSCGCKWAAYAWGRSPAYKRFEGRQCSHVSALRFEVGARGMFGRDIAPDTDRMEGQHQWAPVQVEHQRGTDRSPEKPLTRRTVPPGNMRTEWSGRSRVRVKGSLEITPAKHLARALLAEGATADVVLGQLTAVGIPHTAARQALAWASVGPESGMAQIGGELHQIVHVDPHADTVTTATGETYPADQVLAPNWHPTIGLDPHTSATHPEGEAEATAPDHGGTADPGTDIPRIELRDQSDAKKDPKHKKHHTNDTRMHAPNFGQGVAGTNYAWCDQCGGSGCGHCGGTGQVLTGIGATEGPGAGDLSATTSPVADQNEDAGDLATGAETMSATGSRQNAFDYGHDAGYAYAAAPEGQERSPVDEAAHLAAHWFERAHAHHVRDGFDHGYQTYLNEEETGLPHKGGSYSSDSFMSGNPGQTYQAPTPHSQSSNPVSTGWATSSDPPDWEQPIIGSGFGIGYNAMLHTADEDHDVLYHLTDQHHFQPSAEHAPQDNAFAIQDRSHYRGLYATKEPERWVANGYKRPYVAEIHVPHGIARDERWHGEQFIPAEHFDKIKINRVMPYDAHVREQYGSHGPTETDLGTEFDTGKKVDAKPWESPFEGYHYPGPDVRDMSDAEHSHHLLRQRNVLHDVHGWGWNEFNDKHEHVGLGDDDYDPNGNDIRRDRAGKVMTRGRYANLHTAVTPEEHAAYWANEPESPRCTNPWCKDEPEHTEAEHIDPPDRDPNSDAYRDAMDHLEDAMRPHKDALDVLDTNPDGPTKHSKKEGEPSFEPYTHAGIALKAADTGRILMIQRSNKDEKDPARGTWEFPGGGAEEGDVTSMHTAQREFEEEVGHKFPAGGHLSHVWRSGNYIGHVVTIPEESAIDFSNGRATVNPDDPDGDDHEQSAWWDPEHARKNPALREECKNNPWGAIKKASTWNYTPQDMDSAPDDGPIVHAAGTVPPRRLRPGDHVLFDSGASMPIHAATPTLFHFDHPSGRPTIMHRGPIEGDFSNTIEGREASRHSATYLPWGHDEQMDHDREHPREPSGLHVPGMDPHAEDHCAYCGDPREGDEVDGTGLCARCHNIENPEDPKHREPMGGSTHVWWAKDQPMTGQHEPFDLTGYLPEHRRMHTLNMLHDEPEPALPSTDSAAEDVDAPEPELEQQEDVGPQPGIEINRTAPWGYPEPPPGTGEPEPVNDPGSADHDMLTDDTTNNLPFRADASLDLAAIQASPVLTAFSQTAGFRALVSGNRPAPELSERQAAMQSTSQSGRQVDYSDADIAAAAREALSKTGMKEFSYAEQQDLINEGITSGVRARNFADLKLAGTHYDHMVEDEDDAYPW